MSALRYLFAVFVGLLSGLVWAVVLVDFTPRFYDALPVYGQVGLLVLPLLVCFICSLGLSWWSMPAQIAYMLPLMGLWIYGSIENELRNAGDLSHIGLFGQLTFHLFGAGFLLLSWLAGRALNRALQNRQHGRQAADPLGPEAGPPS